MASSVANIRRGRAFPEQLVSNSIPLKNDELPPARPRKNDGFGFSQSRFASSAEPTPGPGAYYKPSSFDAPSESHSKKGLGNGFVSKSKRFGGTRQKDKTPGPGEHEAVQPPSKKAGGRAAFAQPVREAINRKAPDPPAPGPGSYSPASALLTSTTDPAHSAFASKTERAWFQAPPTVGPGQYDAALPAADSHSYAAAFKSNEPRTFARSGSLGPGPGEYISHGTLLKDLGTRGPSSVMPPEKSRAPRSDVLRKEPLPLPGPGTYDADATPIMKSVPNVSSAFKSTSTRGKDPLHDIPIGPGAYQLPPAAQKESFIFNREQKWI
eukprot:TRINITY_DN12340_c0_g1_i1.p1 TRINITY_DN12340_c0_g1~~TRINITY_DN12340_c0_g1_i1.p1  ORF type:complete len:324 (+),score=36.63 TRINITY_DN12340_c0_g1_i1:249-1220(+)